MGFPVLAERKKALAVLLGGMIVAALAYRFLFLTDISFWLDEQISIGVAGEGPLYCVPAALRFSGHPPAFYCQLSIWMLLGRGDTWIMLNAIFWNVAAILTAFFVFRKRYDLLTALGATLSLALLPQMLAYALNVRMYSFMVVFSLLVWHFTEKTLGSNGAVLDAGTLKRDMRWRMLCQLLLGYTHALGPFYAALHGLYALWRARTAPSANARRAWFKYEVATGLLLLPVVINGFLRETQHTNSADMKALMDMVAINFFSGYAGMGVREAALLALALGFITLGAWRDRDIRRLGVFWVALPALLLLVITLGLKPILSPRIWAPFLPFFCLALALSLSRLKTPGILKAGLAAFWLGMLVYMNGAFWQQFEKPNDYHAVAATLTTETHKGDTVYLYGGPTAWGTLRSLLGPEWGSVLDVQAPANSRWQRVEAALGPALCARLRLCAKTDRLSWQGRALVLFQSDMTLRPDAARVWLVYDAADDAAAQKRQLKQAGYIPQAEDERGRDHLILYIKGAVS
ncbi:hypothetical protein [Kordiimonas marina]|uniref:hypothetical protein n=1 Tax=Kordiimonas marina TaxID=2872312 RepID=UPI001FF3F1A2|nr:hypothetical protein [Kordiimonas marina]MCJ9430786.1 hypothetical protein [Kordiimonas marina]